MIKILELWFSYLIVIDNDSLAFFCHGQRFINSMTLFLKSWLCDRLILFSINSLWPSDACMHQWTGASLVYINTCESFGTSPPVLMYHINRKNILWKFAQNLQVFIKENCLKFIICDITAILVLGRDWIHTFHIPLNFHSLDIIDFYWSWSLSN